MLGTVKKINIRDQNFATICILQKDSEGKETEWWYYANPSELSDFFKLKQGDEINFTFEKKDGKSWIKTLEIAEKLHYVPANQLLEEETQQKAINKAVALKCAIEYLKLWDLKNLPEIKVRKLVVDVAKGFEKYLNGE